MKPKSFRTRLAYRGAAGAVVLVLVAALAALSRQGYLGPTGDDYARLHNKSFRVAKVVDGDTLALDVPDGRHPTTHVRLWGVDTPETVDPRKVGADYFGPEASAFAKELAGGQTVRVELLQEQTRDKYDRILAYVYLPDGSMLNERLLEGGYGYADLRFKHPRFERFKQIEHRAMKAKRGLWDKVRPEQWPEWRQRMLGVETAN